MRRWDRVLAVVGILATVALVKVGQEAYRWRRFAPERAEIVRLEDGLEAAGIGVVRTQVEADTLRRVLEALDAELREARGALDVRERRALDPLSRGSLTDYYRSLESYNRQVHERNEIFAEWRRSLEENRVYVDRYNQVADSIRVLAERMGEPYYPIRTPAEIAVVRGWGRPDG